MGYMAPRIACERKYCVFSNVMDNSNREHASNARKSYVLTMSDLKASFPQFSLRAQEGTFFFIRVPLSNAS